MQAGIDEEGSINWLIRMHNVRFYSFMEVDASLTPSHSTGLHAPTSALVGSGD